VGQSRPSATNRTTTTTPSGGGQKKKRVVLGTKCKQDKAPADQVIIEHLPYHGPRSPLDQVTVEHIFRCLFEAFRHISHAARIDSLVRDDAQPSKRARASLLRMTIMPKYVMILLVYSVTNFDLYSDNMVVHRKSLA
jgi:hypothetical protein